MSSRINEVVKAHKNPKRIRNICIIAHVDHGKTTLADSLIASNGIISEKLAGSVRYLDNRKDEQERMITMKASNISLLFKTPHEPEPYLVNLIDSPGHVDFGGEVSSAVRLSDGALVVVDAVEGVCNQTHTVLRQAWKENVQPCLVINKIDRLITELKLEPEEAYLQLNKILESVNVIMATLFAEDVFKKKDALSSSNNNESAPEEIFTEEELDDSEVYFSPERGNVLFACAKAGWGFRIQHFAEMYAKRLGMNRNALNKTLWGEYFFCGKDKSIKRTSNNGKYPRMFVQFVLQNIWHLYRVILDENSLEGTKKVINVLGLKIADRDMRIFNTPKPNFQPLLATIFRQWLPLSSAIIYMCIEKLPSPVDAQSTRIPKFIAEPPEDYPADLREGYQKIKDSLMQCKNGDDDPVVVFVSKVIASPAAESDAIDRGAKIYVPKSSDDPNSSETNEVIEKDEDEFIGFARIFSGNLRVGSKIHVFGPRYDPRFPTKHVTVMEANDIYMLMGRGLERLECIPAGNIFGLGGIKDHILKTATLSSEPFCFPLSSVQFSQPIVRVAVEPKNPGDMPILISGLKKLNQADASVEIYVQDSGEHVICAAGEMHLERCLLDLREMFCRIELEVSPPIVSFKETITKNTQLKFATRGNIFSLNVTTKPLPQGIVAFLRSNEALIKELFSSKAKKKSKSFTDFQSKLMEKFIAEGHEWSKEFEHVWCFGPKRCGTNILFNRSHYSSTPFWKSICVTQEAILLSQLNPEADAAETEANESETDTDTDIRSFAAPEKIELDEEDQSYIQNLSEDDRWKINIFQSVDFSLTNGFQLTTAAGGLCEEPLDGVAIFLDSLEITRAPESELNKYGPFKGQLMSTICQGLKQAIENGCPHIVEPFYHATIQIPTKLFGDATSVLFQRRSKITNENFLEGTDICIIDAEIPVVESFGFADQIIRKTSGAARTQMQFSHWAVLDQDPNWEPTTEDEKEEFGSNAGAKGENFARQLVNNIRRRKGLHVEEKLVEHADKQRTLSKNK